MIRLTVLYNLPDGDSEESFLEWRLTEHQENNKAMPGVVRTDFACITDIWPPGAMPDYRFQTIVEWPDRKSFEEGFYSKGVQDSLGENLKRLGKYAFHVSEILTNSET
jgi:hypothetical protein